MTNKIIDKIENERKSNRKFHSFPLAHNENASIKKMGCGKGDTTIRGYDIYKYEKYGTNVPYTNEPH